MRQDDKAPARALVAKRRFASDDYTSSENCVGSEKMMQDDKAPVRDPVVKSRFTSDDKTASENLVGSEGANASIP